MVLHRGDQHFVAGLNAGAAEGLRDQVDTFRCAAHKYDLVRVRSVDELLRRAARRFVIFRRDFRKVVHAAMDIGVASLVVAHDCVNHRARFLGRGGVVQVNQRLSVNSLLKDRKIGANSRDVKPAAYRRRALFGIELSGGSSHATRPREAAARRNAWSWISFSMCVRTGPSFMRSMHSLANATSSSLRADISSIPRERR